MPITEKSKANLIPIKKGAKGLPNAGRKKSLLVHYIKDNFVSNVDVSLIIKNIIFEKNEEQLISIMNDKKEPMLIRNIISAYLTDFKRGTLDNLEILLNRIYGKPKETIDMRSQVDNRIEVVFRQEPIKVEAEIIGGKDDS